MMTSEDDAAALLCAPTSEQDDAAFLRDAIALLDASSSEDPVSAIERSATPAKAAATSTTGRRRNEISQLRAQVDALEATRCALRKRRRQEADSAATAVPQPPTVLWEPLAARQRELCERAMQDNARLKRALDELTRQRDALASVLQKERARKTMALVDGGNSFTAAPVTHPTRALCSRDALFEELMGSLWQQYLETPGALKMARAALPAYHPLRCSEHGRVTLRRTIESASHVIYPFSYADTVPEVWTALSGVADDKPGINFSSVDMNEDSFRLEVMIDVQHQRRRSEFHLTTVAKRIVEPNRTVLVWTGLAVPRGVGSVSMEGISVRQRGWSVVEPVGSGDLAGGSTSAATRLTMYFEDAVLVEDGVQKKSSKISMLQQYLLNIYQLEGGARRQQTENKLFDRALARSTVQVM